MRATQEIYGSPVEVVLNCNLVRVLVLSVSVGFLLGCADDRRAPSVVQEAASDPWQYPIKLGDTRARVHELLGAPSHTTAELEEYPPSGLTVWFDLGGRVTKLNFAGAASAIYSGSSSTPIPSDRQLLFGLTSHTDEAGFRSILGTAARETQERSTNRRELQCVWKKDGYVIEGLFLAAERTYEEKTYASGTLLWIEVYRGL